MAKATTTTAKESKSAEQYLTLAEVEKILATEQKSRGSLSPDKLYALEHAKLFSKLPIDKSKTLVHELQSLERVSIAHAYKLIEIMPETPDEVRLIFARERFTLTTEEIDSILKIINKYRQEQG